MTLFLAICLGIGLALGVGLRPFLPALLVGALARGDLGIDFQGTDLSFLESPVFLLALLIGVITLDLGLQAVHVTSQSMIYSVRPQAQSRLTAGYMLFYSVGSALGSIAYTPCTACDGARLKTEALLWRIGDAPLADAALAQAARFMPQGVSWSPEVLTGLPGLCIHDLVLLPVERSSQFFENLKLPAPFDEATELLLGEIRGRFRYLVDVGLGYLTLDRQSRTLSGGEVQRINLTTALGTSLVNTLFVLDEPSIGLHPRDLDRVVGVLEKLRDAGNTLLVVEHDAQLMRAADRILDLGPGPGRAGGQIVFNGAPAELLRDEQSLTAKYLRGELRVGRSRAPRPVRARDPRLTIRDASEPCLR